MENKIAQIHKMLFMDKHTFDDDTIELIEKTIKKILEYDNRRLNGKVITGVKIKFKDRPKKFNNVKAGQVFEIFNDDILKYCYCIIVSDVDEDIIIGYLDIYSNNPLQVEEIFNYIKERKFVFFANTGLTGIINNRWKYITDYSVEILSKDEILSIPYQIFFNGKYYKSIGDSTKEILDCDIISTEEAESIFNPLGIVGELEIQSIIKANYKKKLNK
ncbi:hypothetical protein [Bacillus rubiinfantis]|uniref:hypothetical protein n=1 Tax=Bacillus rubiinfantis TaxID=1499680 RepID=UPI0005AB2BE2|nr:hypothetical protein [Bacillus rubiinfantis]